MMKINHNNLFDAVELFLSDRVMVGNLSTGAKLYGGCTKIDDRCYSNVEKSDFITLYSNKKNTLSVLVPSTKDADKMLSKEEHLSYIKKYNAILTDKFFERSNILLSSVEGSWYSDDLNKVIVEKSGMLSVQLDDVTELDIKFFERLALDIKEELTQECVSIFVNDSLVIV